MQYLVSAAQMKRYDADMIESAGIPSMVLMERAAAATADEIIRRFYPERGETRLQCSGDSGFRQAPQAFKTAGYGKAPRVLVVSGCGNNGGDGFAIGRILQEHGFAADFTLIGERKRCSAETDAQIRILENLGNEIGDCLPEKSYDIVIDALFGIGLSREVTGTYREAVERINSMGAYVVSADIPSGIHADTGAVMGTAVRADLTVTYGYCKLGLVFYPGADYAGELICRKIGIFCRNGQEKPAAFRYDRSDFAGIPARIHDGNKGSFGRVLVIAGSRRIYGACQLAALGAYRMGAGLVRVVTARENRELLLSAVPEAIVDIYGEEFPEALLAEGLKWADCVLIGPGIGTEGQARRIMEYIWRRCGKPLIVDADGLNLLAAHDEWLEEGTAASAVYLTPHMGEFARLTKKSIKCCKEERISTVKEYAKTCRAVVVSKDARTLVADPSGAVYINTSGDDGMATGGSGDVLAGILAGLLAQGMEGMEAACMAVYLHGLAGSRASAARSAYSAMARDILGELPGLLAEGGEHTNENRRKA